MFSGNTTLLKKFLSKKIFFGYFLLHVIVMSRQATPINNNAQTINYSVGKAAISASFFSLLGVITLASQTTKYTNRAIDELY